MKIIRDLSLFKDCCDNSLLDIASSLQTKFFAPKQYIVQRGEDAECFYILSLGSVQVLNDDYEPIALLTEGQGFGEISLLKNVKRTANIVSLTACEVYHLKRKEFDILKKKYPILKKNLTELMESRENKKDIIL